MNKKELRFALNKLITLAENTYCEGLHHKTIHQHEGDSLCPAEYELGKCINTVKQHMKEIKL